MQPDMDSAGNVLAGMAARTAPAATDSARPAAIPDRLPSPDTAPIRRIVLAGIARQAPRLVRRVLRLRGGTGSLVIAVLLLAGGINTLPVHLLPRPQQLWRMPAGSAATAAGAAWAGALPEATEIAVFCLPPNGVAIRCGRAQVRADAVLAFTAYRGGLPPNAAIPVLTSADLGLLWALADPAGKERVRISAGGLAQQLVVAVRDITRSATWQHEYRDTVRRLLTHITDVAWAMPSTQAALQALVHAIEPLVADKVAREIGPAIAPYVADAVWTLIEANGSQMFTLLRGGPPDLSGLSAAFTAALRDPAVQRLLGRLGPEIMALPQMELLGEQLFANLASVAEQDPEAFDLATRIATDRRLGQSLGQLRDEGGAFLRQAGQVMWGLGDSRSLNSLAGEALKTTLTGAARPMVLLLDPDSAMALEHALPSGVVLLVPKAAT